MKVGVYFECLCPDSKAFITTQLYPTMETLGKYLEVEFYPYGNAKVSCISNRLNVCYMTEIIALKFVYYEYDLIFNSPFDLMEDGIFNVNMQF